MKVPSICTSIMTAAFLLGGICAFAVSPARADGSISVELNKLQKQGGACRVYMVFTNGSGAALDSYKPDLVFFGTDGVIAARLVVEGGPLPAGKTKVKLFDVPALDCGEISRVLLNDISACTGHAKAVENCIGITNPSSRGGVEFIK